MFHHSESVKKIYSNEIKFISTPQKKIPLSFSTKSKQANQKSCKPNQNRNYSQHIKKKLSEINLTKLTETNSTHSILFELPHLSKVASCRARTTETRRGSATSSGRRSCPSKRKCQKHRCSVDSQKRSNSTCSVSILHANACCLHSP